MSHAQMLESALRCLNRAQKAMNQAIELTTAQGPAVAIEHIADFLNDTDGIDETVADATPDDWLTRWQVTRSCAAEPHLVGCPRWGTPKKVIRIHMTYPDGTHTTDCEGCKP